MSLDRGASAVDEDFHHGYGYREQDALIGEARHLESAQQTAPEMRLVPRPKTVATRLSVEELREVGAAAKRGGKTLADWLRTVALDAARPVPDVNELLLAEVAPTRYMLLDLFHASAKAAENNEPFLPEAVLKIREAADARKLPTAKKLLEELRAPNLK